MPLVVSVLEAGLAHNTGVVTDLARAALPDHVSVREGLGADALRCGRGQVSQDGRRASRHCLIEATHKQQPIKPGGQLLRWQVCLGARWLEQHPHRFIEPYRLLRDPKGEVARGRHEPRCFASYSPQSAAT